MSTGTENLEQFFDKVWGDNEGYVHLPTRSANNDWTKVWFMWPDHRPHVIKHVLRSAVEKKEVFFAPAIFKETNFSKDSVLGTKLLWADFDGDGGTPAPSDWTGLAETISEPSLRVQTSQAGNEHVYWVLNEFITDHDYIEQKNRSIAYTLNSDTACWNINRLLRPPVSVNFGYSKPERKGKTYEVEIAELSTRQYSRDDFLD